jgi:S-(hydroxymethyl)glutathione dehydrogenase/alcohol dehydrogenase
MRIRAAVLERTGGRLEVADLELAPPGEGEVLVRVAAAGVCRSDRHVIDGAARDPLPAVLGHEGAGIVEGVGPGVPAARVGTKVALAWARGCGACDVCRRGRPNLCFEGIAGGTLPSGGTRLSRNGAPVFHSWGVSCFATRAVVPAGMAIPVPEETDLEVAALIGCAATTGVGAVLKTARVVPGASAAVIGCGGVGLSILQGLRLAGAAPIVAVDRGEARLAAARAAGATEAVDALAGDPVAAVMRLTGGGADYAFEAVGLPATAAQAVAMLAPGGVAVIAGMPAEGARLEIDLNALWSGERRILTSVYGSCDPREDFPRILRYQEEGRLDLGSLVTRRYPLERINEAFADLDTAGPGRGLVVMVDSWHPAAS